MNLNYQDLPDNIDGDVVAGTAKYLLFDSGDGGPPDPLSFNYYLCIQNEIGLNCWYQGYSEGAFIIDEPSEEMIYETTFYVTSEVTDISVIEELEEFVANNPQSDDPDDPTPDDPVYDSDIISQCNRLKIAKDNMRNSIINKGVTVPTTATLDRYSKYIDCIGTSDTPTFTTPSSNQLTRLQNAKIAIRNSINNKNVTLTTTPKIDEYYKYIDQIVVEPDRYDIERQSDWIPKVDMTALTDPEILLLIDLAPDESKTFKMGIYCLQYNSSSSTRMSLAPTLSNSDKNGILTNTKTFSKMTTSKNGKYGTDASESNGKGKIVSFTINYSDLPYTVPSTNHRQGYFRVRVGYSSTAANAYYLRSLDFNSFYDLSFFKECYCSRQSDDYSALTPFRTIDTSGTSEYTSNYYFSGIEYIEYYALVTNNIRPTHNSLRNTSVKKVVFSNKLGYDVIKKNYGFNTFPNLEVIKGLSLNNIGTTDPGTVSNSTFLKNCTKLRTVVFDNVVNSGNPCLSGLIIPTNSMDQYDVKHMFETLPVPYDSSPTLYLSGRTSGYYPDSIIEVATDKGWTIAYK